MNYDFNTLIIEAQAGDKTALEVLYNKNKKLIFTIAKSLNRGYSNIEDIFQTGSIGLVKAIRTFDINKGIQFSTYAGKCIKNKIIKMLKKDAYLYIEDSLNDEIMISNTNEVGIDLHLDFKTAISKLRPKYKKIIELYFYEDMDENKIANLLNLSRQRINIIKSVALLEMRKYLSA